jgi:agmatine deiminase
MPAEWEPHAATWVVWPHNRETWPGCLPQAELEFLRMVEVLAASEDVHIVVQSAGHAAHVQSRLGSIPAELHVIPTDDAWMRDIGPTFVEDDADGPVAIDWTFNAWGGKYPPWDRDDRVARAVAELVGVRCLRPDLVLEGGALEVDGLGTLLTTESTLLDPKRNAGIGREALEAKLADLLGVREVVWLQGKIEGDDTDGHIDDIARFVAPGRVVCARESDRRDPNHAPLEACRARLLERFEVTDLPMPQPLRAAGSRLPASYANFYIANRAVLVPVFAVAADALALAVLDPLFPDRDVVGIPSRYLVRGLGAVHCLTQQEPS